MRLPHNQSCKKWRLDSMTGITALYGVEDRFGSFITQLDHIICCPREKNEVETAVTLF
jgi:hypothetical protein